MNQEKIRRFISELRKEKGMTQEQLAERMWVTDKSISRWKNGKTMQDISLCNNAFGYLNYIFTPNAIEFVQGALYGICICANMISLHNLSHNISIFEKKKRFIN